MLKAHPCAVISVNASVWIIFSRLLLSHDSMIKKKQAFADMLISCFLILNNHTHITITQFLTSISSSYLFEMSPGLLVSREVSYLHPMCFLFFKSILCIEDITWNIMHILWYMDMEIMHCITSDVKSCSYVVSGSWLMFFFFFHDPTGQDVFTVPVLFSILHMR